MRAKFGNPLVVTGRLSRWRIGIALICATVSIAGCALDPVRNTSQPAAATTQSNENLVAAGLKEALRVGTDRAVASTSQSGGFLDNPLLRIALPEQFNQVIDVLRSLGLGALVTSFETTMNRAAEQAAATATPVFVDAISTMSWSDAYGVLRGSPTAATEFFRTRTSADLTTRFRPIIEQSLNKLGVYQLYKDLITPYQSLPFTDSINLDLADYVTDQTLNGLFTVLGQEEQKIRNDPLARSSELLRRVFSS